MQIVVPEIENKVDNESKPLEKMFKKTVLMLKAWKDKLSSLQRHQAGPGLESSTRLPLQKFIALQFIKKDRKKAKKKVR